MVFRSVRVPLKWGLTPLILALSVGVLLAGCDVPVIGDGTDSERTSAEQPVDSDQQSNSSGDDADGSQQIPDEAFDVGEPQDNETSSPPSRIVEAGLLEPRTLNPVLVGDPLSEEISQFVFSGLTTVDPETGEPVPDLAESWEVSEDGMTYVFDLRANVTWHDGQPFTARDVAFTFDLIMNERTRSPRYSRVVERVVAVEALDDDTVEFRMVAPYAPFLTTISTFGIVPQHVLSDVLPDELVTNPFGISSAVGTGPFELTRWDRGERILLSTNDQYHRGPAQFGQYEYRVIGNEADILSGLAHGSIDWARITPGQMEAAAELPGVRTVSMPSFEMVGVALQLDPGTSQLFEDSRVRRALMLALDRESVVEDIWHGHARVAHGTLPPASSAFVESGVHYEYDPSLAAELLVEAGWATSDDGVRIRDGIPFQFKVVANGDNPTRRALVEWMVESWEEIGVDAAVQFETWGSVRDRVTTSREFDALVLGYRWDIDPDQHAMWSSDSIPDAFNLSSYVNREVDQLLDEALATGDQETRADLYAEVQDLVMEDLPTLPIVFPDQTLAFGSRLHDVEPTAILVRNRATIAEWVPVTVDEVDERED